MNLSRYEKLKKAFKNDPEMLRTLESRQQTEFLKMLSNDKAESETITKQTKIEYLKGEKGDPLTWEDLTAEQKAELKGEKGDKPEKGTDYFTHEEVLEIADFIKESLKEEVRPIKGVDYFDGLDADEDRIVDAVIKKVPTLSEILASVQVPEAEKINKEELMAELVEKLPKHLPLTIDEIVKEIKSKQLLELRDIRGARLDRGMSSQQWHGGGLTTIYNGATLVTNNMTSLVFTGAGISSVVDVNGQVTVTVSGGGGGGETLAQTLAIGNVTGGNDIEMSAGDYIVSPNGQTQIEISNSGLIATTDAGVFGTPYFSLTPTQIELAGLGGGGVVMSLGSLAIAHNTLIQFSTAPVRFNAQTASTIAIFDASKNLISASTATYPDLTELSYVKGVTSSIQTQLNGKQATITPAALTRTDDTNVTLTLGGSPTTALLAATSLTLGWTGQLSLARGGSGASLSDPGFNAAWVWDDTTNATRLAILSGLSYDSGTNTLTASGSGVSFGTVGQIPYTNAATNDFDYSASFSFNGARLLVVGAGTGQVGALHISRGDSVNQYIVLQENAGSAGSAYLTFSGSNPGAMAMGALFTAGVPTSYVFTDTGGSPLMSIDEATGNITMAGSLGLTGTRVSKGWFTDLEVTNAIAGSITGTAAVATTVTAADETTDTSCFIAFVTAATGNLGVKTNANLTFNSNTGVLTAGQTIVGSISGNAGTASAVAVGGITGLGTGVATALAINIGSAGAFVTFNGALGTPSSGTVTNLTGTASININGTVGATTPTTGVFTTATINTVLNPDTDGGAGLGSATLGFSILGLSSGSTINFANSNVVLTHSSGILTVSTGDLRVTTAGTNTASVVTVGGTQTLTAKTLTSPIITTATLSGVQLLSEGASIGLDPAGSADGAYSGITMTGTSGYSQAFGDLVYLSSVDSRWEAADADSATTGDRLLAMVVVAGTDGNACTLLLQGTIRADAKFPALTIGSAVYVGEAAGEIQVAIPTGADNVIRRVGYALTADSIYFNPSMDSQISVA